MLQWRTCQRTSWIRGPSELLRQRGQPAAAKQIRLEKQIYPPPLETRESNQCQAELNPVLCRDEKRTSMDFFLRHWSFSLNTLKTQQTMSKKKWLHHQNPRSWAKIFWFTDAALVPALEACTLKINNYWIFHTVMATKGHFKNDKCPLI